MAEEREQNSHAPERRKAQSLFPMLVSQLLAIIPQRQPCQMAHRQLQQSKAASRDAVMVVSQPTSWESPAPVTITWALPCPRSRSPLQVTVSHKTPPVSVFGGLYCVKSHTHTIRVPCRLSSRTSCPFPLIQE